MVRTVARRAGLDRCVSVCRLPRNDAGRHGQSDDVAPPPAPTCRRALALLVAVGAVDAVLALDAGPGRVVALVVDQLGARGRAGRTRRPYAAGRGRRRPLVAVALRRPPRRSVSTSSWRRRPRCRGGRRGRRRRPGPHAGRTPPGAPGQPARPPAGAGRRHRVRSAASPVRPRSYRAADRCVRRRRARSRGPARRLDAAARAPSRCSAPRRVRGRAAGAELRRSRLLVLVGGRPASSSPRAGPAAGLRAAAGAGLGGAALRRRHRGRCELVGFAVAITVADRRAATGRSPTLARELAGAPGSCVLGLPAARP